MDLRDVERNDRQALIGVVQQFRQYSGVTQVIKPFVGPGPVCPGMIVVVIIAAKPGTGKNGIDALATLTAKLL